MREDRCHSRVSKAAPLEWLRKFLETHDPKCDGKYVVLDKGGELYASPKVRVLFASFGYEVRPTGTDTSHLNGHVERGHQTVANGVCALLTGANLDVKFWPGAFHHWLRINNSLPCRNEEQSLLLK